jgi:hypothetical protein
MASRAEGDFPVAGGSAPQYRWSSLLEIRGCDPDAFRRPLEIHRFARDLCVLTGMRRLGETLVLPMGLEGAPTGWQLIQTTEASWISGRFCLATGTVLLCVRSDARFNPRAVEVFATNRFHGDRCFLLTEAAT